MPSESTTKTYAGNVTKIISNIKLIEAIKQKDLDRVRSLVNKEGADVNYPGENGTPLAVAINAEALDIIEFLLTKTGGEAEVVLAVRSNKLVILQKLCNTYPDLLRFIDSITGENLLHLAIRAGAFDCVTFLMSKMKVGVFKGVFKKDNTGLMPLDLLKEIDLFNWYDALLMPVERCLEYIGEKIQKTEQRLASQLNDTNLTESQKQEIQKTAKTLNEFKDSIAPFKKTFITNGKKIKIIHNTTIVLPIYKAIDDGNLEEFKRLLLEEQKKMGWKF